LKKQTLILLLAIACTLNVFAKPPKVKAHKVKSLGIKVWSELGKRALIHHARKRLTDVTNIGDSVKTEYIEHNAKATVAIILYEFASGTGPSTRYFYDEQPFTEEFKKGPAMKYMLAQYFSQLDSGGLEPLVNGRYQFSAKAIPFVAETWTFSLKQHYLTLKQVNMSQFVLGSFNYSISEMESGKLHIHVWNTTSRRSLFIGIPKRVQRPLLLGNVYQHIHMELDVDEVQLIRAQ
jgi:hypothetical protein